jgi:hypothetical protein
MDDEKREALAKYERDVLAKHKAEAGNKPYVSDVDSRLMVGS